MTPMSWEDHPNVLPKEIYDQGERGTCTYFAVCTALAAQYYIRTREIIKLSPESILYGVRQEKCALQKIEPSSAVLKSDRAIIEREWPEYEATILDALSYAARYGVAMEHDWPYDVYGSPPSINNIDTLRVHDFEMLTTGRQIKKYIREYPLVCQIQCTQVFGDKYSDDKVYTKKIHFGSIPDGSSCHTMTLVGWGHKDSIPVWIVLNSWGELWGHRGIGYVERVLDDDAEDLGILTAVGRASILPRGLYPASRRVPRLLGLPRDKYRH
ncbi:hypothetical protein OROMI_022815 [Orobanche minor]